MQKIAPDYALTFDSNPLPMWVVDRETMRFVEVNEAALRQYGYGRDEFLALTLRDVRPPRDLAPMLERWRQLLATSVLGTPYSVGPMEHRRRDGSEFVAEVTATPIDFRGRKAFLSVQVDVTDRARAEEQAREDRERFELVSRAVNDTIWDWNIVTGKVWRSENTETVFGSRPDEIEPTVSGWSERIHPEDRDRVVESMVAVVRDGGRTWATEYRLRRRDGSWAHILDRAQVIRDPGGRPVHMVGSMVDVSDRKRIDQELLDQRGRLKAIFDNAQDALFITNSDNRFLDANPAACQMFGYAREELLAREIWDLILEDLTDEYRRRIRALLLTGRQEAEGQGRRRDGTIVEVEYRSVANIEPGIHLTVMRDITKRKRDEKALLEQKGRLQALFDHAQDGIVLVNDEGRYIDANPAACEMYGYTHGELCARAIWDLVLPAEGQVARERFRRLRETGRQSGEAKRVRRDGSVIEMEYRSVANIEPGVHLTVMRDIMKRKRDEGSLRRLSGRLLRLQDEERRRLARELHDSTAQSLAALALELAIVGERGEGLAPRARQALAEAERIADQVSRELRTLSYLLHPPLLDEMGLASALSAYVEGFSKRSGVEVELVMPPDLGRLSGEDETTLFRIVQECLTNVHRHSMSPTARVRLALEPDAIRLEVSDQGRGLAPRGAGGDAGERHDLGVGIAGMKERVHQLGGDLELDSSAEGLTVRAILPRRQP